MSVIDNIMNSKPTLTDEEWNVISGIASELAGANGASGVLHIGSNLTTALAIVLAAGLEALEGENE